ncbi:hypothetical protein MPH_12621 [Macrophomina phaseolina MS6]|uniref:Uncharacterized protein n=1 Tax=Macrophomina phaseolina (strain MS6) TaxID=1126212 RepID=K2S0S0_MACPH|nr:hypothetical protein MPH_12621 [Macrophomina phaseolina MS6]
MSRSATYYIPTHVHCLNIAKRVLHSRRGRLSSMRQLWKALRMRSIATTANGRMEPLARIDAPANYQMPPLAEVVETEGHWCTAGVWNIPNLTASILEKLKPAQAHLTPSTTAFRDRLGKLPQEMRDHIFSFMFSDHGFSSECTYLAPQAAWMNMLLDGHTIPFLWDLDREAVEQKVAEGLSTGIEWDFELLVRELCQRRDGKEGHCPSGMPAGLHNRRRIWGLLEDMYVGDYLPEAACDPPVPGRARAVPRYWDEEGCSQHPLVWLRRDSAAH